MIKKAVCLTNRTDPTEIKELAPKTFVWLFYGYLSVNGKFTDEDPGTV